MRTRHHQRLRWAGAMAGALALATVGTAPALAAPTPAHAAAVAPADPSAPAPAEPAPAETPPGPEAEPQPGPTLDATKTADLDPAGERIDLDGAGFVAGDTLTLATWASAGGAEARPDPAHTVTIQTDAGGRFRTSLTVSRPPAAHPGTAFELRAHPAGDPTRWTAVPVTFASTRPARPPVPPANAPAALPARAPVPMAAAKAAPRLTVSARTGLNPAGQKLTVSGSGYDVNKGVYVAFCVDKGAGQVPSPCIGGVDMDGGSGSSAWISSNPPPYGKELTKPYGPGGTFRVQLTVKAKDQFTDCAKVSCAVVTRNDHTRSSDRSQDVRVPVTFGSAPQPGTTQPGGTTPAQSPPGTTSAGSLPNTGTGPVLPLALSGLALVALGGLVLAGVGATRRTATRAARRTATQGAPTGGVATQGAAS